MKAQQKNFKWFGEGFDGFPKNLPEDCVEYTIQVINPKLEPLAVRTRLREVQKATNVLLKILLNDFIWQRQDFKLELVHSESLSFLCGRTCYGDSVEDEWLIVYILRELSKQFSDAWIRVVDTDGEFLLIEGANAVPSWLNPEVAEYRVWLNLGNLFIIPMQDLAEKLEEKKASPTTITLREAVCFIEEKRSKLIHSSLIEAEAFYRLQKYPQQIKNSLHHSLVTIPRKLAFVLHEKASFISPAVEAFYLRDPIALRPLQTQDPTKLVFCPNDLVKVSVKFTKVGYAQLKSQQFAVPLAWKSYFSSEKDGKVGDRLEMGMKVTCGFEMLLSDPQNIDHISVREINLLLEDLQTAKACMPSDAEISKWRVKDDDEGWLDIDFDKFEHELAGNSKQGQSRTSEGFGDKTAHENLRKMVARFEDFLNDDNAGAEGAENPDDMDNDDDSSTTDSDSEGEDKDVSFDEEQFASLMREMMGMPADTAADANHDPINSNIDVHPIDDEGFRLHQDMQAMEAELEAAGVFHTHSKLTSDKQLRQARTSEVAHEHCSPSTVLAHESDTDDDLDIDYNLAKNLLESFKSQNGASGPGGNLMGLLEAHLPRDEVHNDHRQHV